MSTFIKAGLWTSKKSGHKGELNLSDLISGLIPTTTTTTTIFSPTTTTTTTVASLAQYISVAADGTAVQNATELAAAYTAAQALSPSATNRITIIAAPGYYDFGSSPFIMNTGYIDLVSLDGNISVLFNSANAAGTISITANNAFVKGIDVGTKNFTIATNLNLLKVENCKGGNSSFGGQGGITVSGTFTNCVGGDVAFGSGGGGKASGTFTNCVATSGAFGGNGGSASGIFTNCVATTGAFGSVIKGVPTLSGKLYYCRLTLAGATFTGVSSLGITRLCLDGNNVENNQG